MQQCPGRQLEGGERRDVVELQRPQHITDPPIENCREREYEGSWSPAMLVSRVAVMRTLSTPFGVL